MDFSSLNISVPLSLWSKAGLSGSQLPGCNNLKNSWKHHVAGRIKSKGRIKLPLRRGRKLIWPHRVGRSPPSWGPGPEESWPARNNSLENDILLHQSLPYVHTHGLREKSERRGEAIRVLSLPQMHTTQLKRRQPGKGGISCQCQLCFTSLLSLLLLPILRGNYLDRDRGREKTLQH